MSNIAKKMAKTRSAILITGESGTGKELFAHAIHNASERCNGPIQRRSLLSPEYASGESAAFAGKKRRYYAAGRGT